MRHFGAKPKQKPLKDWTIVRDDYVQVITGKYSRSRGKVLKVYRQKNQVLVQGVNLKYQVVEDDEDFKRKKTSQKEYPIHVSNVSLIDPETDKPTTVSYGYLEDGSKVRVSKKSGAVIAKPNRSELTYINRTKEKQTGVNDTKPEDVLLKTYKGEDFLKVKADFDAYIQ